MICVSDDRVDDYATLTGVPAGTIVGSWLVGCGSGRLVISVTVG
jgi:hypothetical protein